MVMEIYFKLKKKLSGGTILYTDFCRLPKDSQSPSTSGTPSAGQNNSITSSTLPFVPLCAGRFFTVRDERLMISFIILKAYGEQF